MVSHPQPNLASNPFALRTGGWGDLALPKHGETSQPGGRACPGQRWLRLGLRPPHSPQQLQILVAAAAGGAESLQVAPERGCPCGLRSVGRALRGFCKSPDLRRRNARLPRQEHGESFARLRGRPVGEPQAGRGILSGRCCCCCCAGGSRAGRPLRLLPSFAN